MAHTSGSTGKPKEIRLLKADMRASARATLAYFGLDSSSTLAFALSPDYIAGKMMIVRAEEAGARLLALPVSNTVQLDEDVDLLAVVPSQLESLLARPECVGHIKNLLIGGAAPSPQQCAQLTALGCKAFISYGMTETCSHVAIADAADAERVSHAMPGITFGLTADGRLAINCPAFSFRYLETNDLVELLSPTSFRWRGRADGVINSGGLKLLPEELEALYAEVLPHETFYVTAEPDDKWGMAVVLVVQADAAEAPMIAARLRERIADHRRLPKHVYAVASLPHTATGKLLRLPPSKL